MTGDILEKRTYITALYDLYKNLLTEKQKEAMRLFYEEDCSLSEIADFFSGTRQAAADILKRTVALLEHYEEALSLYAKQQRKIEITEELKTLLIQADMNEEAKREALFLLENIGR